MASNKVNGTYEDVYKDRLEAFATKLLGRRIKFNHIKLVAAMTFGANGDQLTHGFMRRIDLVYYQTFLSILNLTHVKDFNNLTDSKKQKNLFQVPMEQCDNFRVFVRLSLMVFLSWLITPPEEASPASFLKSAKEMLKIVISEPFSNWEMIQVRTFKTCPVFFQRILGVINPNLVAFKWTNNYDKSEHEITNIFDSKILRGGKNTGMFYEMCILELIYSLVDPVHTRSECLLEVIKAVNRHYLTASEALEQVTKVWKRGGEGTKTKKSGSSGKKKT
jgi:hypothetical protein